MLHNNPTMSIKTHLSFSHLIGNEKAKEVLTRLAVSQKLPHVLLFYGLEGVGKGVFALELAQFLVGKVKKDHPDIHILFPDPKSHQHPVATIRQLIQEAGLPPFESPV